ncbi:alginate export family protein [Microbulbifer pacificus]|uniref:alginate export family protein n=1 Tax=Microbulbifer pacificus TaxID=407164 RepID=UPI00131A10F1|nr:alginate export family protein [Microbulbifer pacificus]
MDLRIRTAKGLLLLVASTPLLAQEREAEPASGHNDGSPRIRFDGSYRLRYESLNNSFRHGNDDQLAVSRLLAHLRYTGDHWFAGGELQDSRAWKGDRETPLGTDDINVLTPLQYYLGWRGTWRSGDLEVKAGRLTADLGSRRLLARNRFRNTLNNFEGVGIQWQPAHEHPGYWQAFWYNPIQRNPVDRPALAENDYGVDRALRGTRIWGLYRETEALVLYALRLDESDQPNVATRDRELTTLGFFSRKAAIPDTWGYELEAAWQFGYSRSGTSPDASRLLHRAGFAHGEWRYQFNDALRSQLRLQLDYASGDRSEADDENNRFDTLYGARRFDFGPTGIWGAFARTNIVSPGVRWQFQSGHWIPEATVQGLVGYRAIWRASTADGQSTAGISADNGARFVGHQWEVRLQAPLTESVESEIGGAYLARGAALKDASGETVPATYLYCQVTLKF